MTGAILRRLREAYGLTRRQLSDEGGLSLPVIESTERCGRSYTRNSAASGRQSRNYHRYNVWLWYLNTLRDVKATQITTKPPASPAKTSRPDTLPIEEETVLQNVVEDAFGKPSPDAVQVEYLGMREWVKVSTINGRKYGFIWRNGDWYRSAWVEARLLRRAVKQRFATGDEAFAGLPTIAGRRHG